MPTLRVNAGTSSKRSPEGGLCIGDLDSIKLRAQRSSGGDKRSRRCRRSPGAPIIECHIINSATPLGGVNLPARKIVNLLWGSVSSCSKPTQFNPYGGPLQNAKGRG